MVNFRGVVDTVPCVTSLLASTYSPHLVVVVDNDSGGDDVELLRRQFGDRIDLIASPRNLGYGGAANLGIRDAMLAGASYVWILNNDTVVAGDAVGTLVRAMEANPSVGAASPEIEAPPGPESPAGVWFSGGIVRLNRAETRHELVTLARRPGIVPTQFLTGCAMLLRCDALEGDKAFWERLFLYWEDVDLSLRLRAAGWIVAVVPTAVISHFPHGSIESGVATPQSFRNAVLVARRNAATPDVATAVAFLGARLLRAWGSALLRRQPAPVAETLGFISGASFAVRWTIRRPPELRVGIRSPDPRTESPIVADS